MGWTPVVGSTLHGGLHRGCGASIPLEGAYALVGWLLKCTQCVDGNIISPLHRSVKDALHHQDKEVQKAAEVAKAAAEKVSNCSQDSSRRQHYREAQDHDSEPSDSEKEVSKALESGLHPLVRLRILHGPGHLRTRGCLRG